MINFGKRIELMVDKFLIESTDRCSFTPVIPECIAKAIDFDKAWERPGSLGVTAFDDNGTVKLYYRGFPIHNSSGDANEKQTACLAVSEDGVNFTDGCEFKAKAGRWVGVKYGVFCCGKSVESQGYAVVEYVKA